MSALLDALDKAFAEQARKISEQATVIESQRAKLTTTPARARPLPTLIGRVRKPPPGEVIDWKTFVSVSDWPRDEFLGPALNIYAEAVPMYAPTKHFGVPCGAADTDDVAETCRRAGAV
jgi:hypothetical protein